MDVVELAPHMCPAGRLLDLLTVEPVKAGIGIGLQHAGEARQVRPRTLTLAIGAIAEEHRRGVLACSRSIIPYVRPQPTLLSSTTARA